MSNCIWQGTFKKYKPDTNSRYMEREIIMAPKKYNPTRNILGFISVFLCFMAAHAFAEQQEPNENPSLFEMPLEDLMNVQVVTASRKAQSLSMAASNITVITEKEIKNSGAQTLADLLGQLPGIYVPTQGNGLKSIYIRGIGERYNDKTLLLVDGYPTRDVYYYSYSPDATIPLGNIKRVEVIRGPGSSLYGTGAYAGIINIITKDAEDINGTEVTSGIGSRSSQQHQVLTGKKWEKGQVSFLARYFDADQGKVTRDESGEIAGHTKYIRNAAFHLKANYEDFDFQTGYYRTTVPDAMAAIDEQSTTVTQDMFFRGGYNKKINNRLSMHAKIYANLQWMEEWKRTYDDDGVLDKKKLTSRQSNIVGIDIQWQYKLSERNDLVFGMTHERETLGHHWSKTYDPPGEETPALSGWAAENGGSSPESIRNHSISFYAEDEFKMIPDVLHFTAGVRMDRYTQTGSNLSPRFGAVWMVQKDTVVKLLYGEAFRSPSYREMYKQPGDPLVDKPEKIKTTELLISHNLSSNHHVEMSLFRSDLCDYIKTLSTGGYENLKHRSITGIEAGLKGRFPKADLTYFANCTMLHTKDTGGGGIGGVPENMFNIGLTYEGIQRLSISPHVQYISKRNRPNDYQSDEVEPANQRNNLGSYSLFNITVRTRDLPFELAFSVRNVFDKRFYTTSEKGQYDAQGEGRTFWLTLTYKF